MTLRLAFLVVVSIGLTALVAGMVLAHAQGRRLSCVCGGELRARVVVVGVVFCWWLAMSATIIELRLLAD